MKLTQPTALQQFLKKLKKERPSNFLDSFRSGLDNCGQNPSGEHYEDYFQIQDGSHVFVFNKPSANNGHNPEMIVVRQDEHAFEVYGACAKSFLAHKERLGSPVTGERWMGSGVGRYQLFNKGIIRLEASNGEDNAWESHRPRF